MVFAARKSRLALAAAAGFMMAQVSGPAGAQGVPLERCQKLAGFFSQDPEFFTPDQLDNLASCVAEYRAQRGGVAGETGSPEMGAEGFSGGTPTFQQVPSGQMNLPKAQTPKMIIQE